jgi:hypothetical protein
MGGPKNSEEFTIICATKGPPFAVRALNRDFIVLRARSTIFHKPRSYPHSTLIDSSLPYR